LNRHVGIAITPKGNCPGVSAAAEGRLVQFFASLAATSILIACQSLPLGVFILPESKGHLMTQAEITRAVARVTGESTRTIAELGFGIADPAVVDFDPEPYDVEDKILD
jgi:hypothetical protein